MKELFGEALQMDGVELPEGFCLRKKKDSITPPIEGIYLVFAETGRIAASWGPHANIEQINERIQRTRDDIEEIGHRT